MHTRDWIRLLGITAVVAACGSAVGVEQDTQPEEEEEVEQNTPGLLFSDDFESGNKDRSTNGFHWSSASANVTIEQANPKSGSHSMAFAYRAKPDEQDATAEQILTHMCARCHNSTLDQSLSRARFDATKLAELDDLQKAVIADRIQRHEGDKFQMPPRRSGTMPQWAVTRVLDYLGQ